MNYYFNGDRGLVFRKKMKFYKGDKKTLTVFGYPHIVSNSACGCELSTSDYARMLVMGVTRNYRNYVTYIARVANDKEIRKDIRRINRGYDCTKFIPETFAGTNNGTALTNFTLASIGGHKRLTILVWSYLWHTHTHTRTRTRTHNMGVVRG